MPQNPCRRVFLDDRVGVLDRCRFIHGLGEWSRRGVVIWKVLVAIWNVLSDGVRHLADAEIVTSLTADLKS